MSPASNAALPLLPQALKYISNSETATLKGCPTPLQKYAHEASNTERFPNVLSDCLVSVSFGCDLNGV